VRDSTRRLVIDIHHPGLRRDGLRDLMGVVGRRQPRRDVQELGAARSTVSDLAIWGYGGPVLCGGHPDLTPQAIS
jgi:hypothetical protein